MRGKSILWLSLITMLLGSIMLNLGYAVVGNTKIYLDPDMVVGHPGDTFTVKLKVDNVEDLYGWGVELHIAPYMRTIAVVPPILEGDALKAPGITTYFVAPPPGPDDIIKGTVKIGCTRLGMVPGVSLKEGTLAEITFTVLEAGDSPMNLEAVKLINSEGELMPHQVTDGYYDGPTVNLVGINMPDGRVYKPDEIITINSKVKSEADVPLYAKTRFDLIRDDGAIYTFYSGVHEKYVNAYDFWDWNWPPEAYYGDSPFLDAAEGLDTDGIHPINGIGVEDYNDYGPIPYGTAYNPETGKVEPRYLWYCLADTGYFTFESFTLPEGREITSVTLDLYAWADTDLPNDMMDLYVGNGEGEWLLASLGNEEHCYKYYPAWFSIDATALFNTETKINSATLWTEAFPYYTGDEPAPPSDPVSHTHYWAHHGYYYFSNTTTPLDHAWQQEYMWESIYIDAIKLTITASAIVDANDVEDMDPVLLGPMDVGHYAGLATAYFSSEGDFWVPSEKTKSFFFTVEEDP